MTDYDELADKLKGLQRGGEPARKKLATHGFDPATFYKFVREQVEKEVDKANAELLKRKLPPIERVFMPSFQGKLSLTFGTGLLCNVELQASKGQVKAVIFGPPNRCEISRKLYILDPEAANLQPSRVSEVEKVAVGYSPQKIATEIVSGLLMGKFA
ncbi:MAG: hypothetical protein WBC92_14505 [Terracidiphilus sp.]